MSAQEKAKEQILIVEDDIDLAEMLNAYFRVQGYEVLTAAWGEDALKMCQEVVPDVVVLDIRLPDIDGYEVCRQLRTRRRTENVPIIFLTEKRDRSERRFADRTAGNAGFIVKVDRPGLGGVVFYDGGNVFARVQDLSFDLRHTLGAGLRWASPVGLVRLDLGLPLARQPGEKGYEVFFSLGQAF